MALPRPTPPQRYRPRCGAAAVRAGGKRKAARSLSRRGSGDSTSSAPRRSSRTAASSWLPSDCSRWAATRSARRDSTDLKTLQALVVGTGAAFRRHPGDLIRVRFLDVAGLAMHTVGGVDLQFLPAVSVRDHFIHVGRTKIRAGIAELLD